MTATLPDLEWEHCYVWFPARYDSVRVGNALANWGEITAVIGVPADNGSARPRIRIECGDSYSRTGHPDRLVIIGQRIAEPTEDL